MGALCFLNSHNNLIGGREYDSYFTDEETEAQRRSATGGWSGGGHT